jgi:hypothetical protein
VTAAYSGSERKTDKIKTLRKRKGRTGVAFLSCPARGKMKNNAIGS